MAFRFVNGALNQTPSLNRTEFVAQSTGLKSNLRAGIQEVLSRMSPWRLSPNLSKMKIMLFPFQPEFTSLIHPNFPNPIDIVSSHKHIGIVFDSALSWVPHIEYICQKSSKSLGILFPAAPTSQSLASFFFIQPIFAQFSIMPINVLPSVTHPLFCAPLSLLLFLFGSLCPEKFMIWSHSAGSRSVPPLIYYDISSSLFTCPLRLCCFSLFLTLAFFTELLLLLICYSFVFPPLTFIFRRAWQSPTLLTLAGVSTES